MGLNRREFLTYSAAAGTLLSIGGGTTACGVSGAGNDGDELGPNLPTGDYFKQLGADLTAAGFGTPQIIIDLDRLDANADSIVSEIGQDRYRIVEKSLPSLDLLGYIRNRTGVDRFLVLHLPFLPALLAQFPSAHVLVGKNQPILAVKAFFDSLASDADRADAASRVAFLVDGPTRAAASARSAAPGRQSKNVFTAAIGWFLPTRTCAVGKAARSAGRTGRCNTTKRSVPVRFWT